jgi:RNA-directed DNA polymerase
VRARSNRTHDKRAGNIVLFPVRYADDFIILVGAPHGAGQPERAHTVALAEKAALAKVLQETLNLELSDAKTAVTPVTSPMRFLGHHVRVRRSPIYGWCSKCVIPKDRSKRLRSLVRRHFASVAGHEKARKNGEVRAWASWGGVRRSVGADAPWLP